MDGETTEQTQDFYKPDSISTGETASAPPTPHQSIQWSASEFLHHQKSMSWYVQAGAALAVLSLLLFVLTRDIFGPISVVVLGSMLLVVAGRKPRTVEYIVDDHGITIGKKEYTFDEFQSFSLVQEDQIESIAIFPHKRFAPVVSLYFAPDDGQRIFDLLSDYLPFEQREKDRIDKFLHKIKF